MPEKKNKKKSLGFTILTGSNRNLTIASVATFTFFLAVPGKIKNANLSPKLKRQYKILCLNNFDNQKLYLPCKVTSFVAFIALLSAEIIGSLVKNYSKLKLLRVRQQKNAFFTYLRKSFRPPSPRPPSLLLHSRAKWPVLLHL